MRLFKLKLNQYVKVYQNMLHVLLLCLFPVITSSSKALERVFGFLLGGIIVFFLLRVLYRIYIIFLNDTFQPTQRNIT